MTTFISCFLVICRPVNVEDIMVSLCIYLVLFLTSVYGSSAFGTNNQVYQPINKENIRNSFNVDDVNYSKRTVKINDVNTILENISRTFLPKFLKLNIENDSVKLSFNDFNEVGRKMDSNTNNVMQYMLVPSFLMAGILPWVMPKLQMAVMIVSMLNNMIFSSALFSLVRSYVFEQQPDEHVIYINQGYRNKPQTAEHHEEHYR